VPCSKVVPSDPRAPASEAVLDGVWAKKMKGTD